ncbi:MAG: DUF1365 domain-containing protein [Jatrophihabitantaceae bacterium]
MSGRPGAPTRKAAGAATPACYDVRITHHRRDPLDYRFSNTARTWLVDLDALPQLPRGLGRLCRFDPRDHLLDGAAHVRRETVRTNVNRWLLERGVPRPARVLMLAGPRVLGYVFNPLSVFYCYTPDGRLEYVVAEVRNTYGGRHCYLLHPGPRSCEQVDKVFYVSPFHPVDGRYEIRVPEPGDRLAVTVTLHRPGAGAFTAVMTGTRRSSASLWSALRTPLATRAVMVHIRRHGIRLYTKGLRPVPQPRRARSPQVTR